MLAQLSSELRRCLERWRQTCRAPSAVLATASYARQAVFTAVALPGALETNLVKLTVSPSKQVGARRTVESLPQSLGLSDIATSEESGRARRDAA